MKKRFQKMSGSDSFDMDLCLADMYAGVTRMLKKHYISLSNARFSKENYDDVLRSVLKSLYEDMLSKTVLLDSLKYCHNQQFSIVGNRLIRPLLLEDSDLEDVFLDLENN
jgi:hypothetical protein